MYLVTFHLCSVKRVSCVDDSPTHLGAIEHGDVKIAHTGLNPRLGNELQLQRMESNYINCLPVDRALSLFPGSGTHLQSCIIAFDLSNRQPHTAKPRPNLSA